MAHFYLQKHILQKGAILLMWLLAIMNLGFLIWVIIDPIPTATFVGLSINDPQGQVELRAMYGGLIGGLGVLNLLGALYPHRLNAALWCTSWTFAGVGTVRTVSCLTLGIGSIQALFAFLEVGAALTCFILMCLLEKESQ